MSIIEKAAARLARSQQDPAGKADAEEVDPTQDEQGTEPKASLIERSMAKRAKASADTSAQSGGSVESASTQEPRAAQIESRSGNAAAAPNKGTDTAPPVVARSSAATPPSPDAMPSADATPSKDAVTSAAASPPAEALAAEELVETYAELDLEDLKSRGYLTPAVTRSRLAQDLRRIKRPLLLNVHNDRQNKEVGGRPPNLIMLTSALPGEGKTFLSINLAMSLAAELNHRVLLVDGDLAKGDVARQLNIRTRRGLSDLLQQDHYQLEDGVLSTNVEGLSVLPSGRPADNVDELFASRQMAKITRCLAEEDQDRTIVFDAPPLMATTEANVLASVMGQVVVVVEAQRTPQSVVEEAVAQLKNCPNVSLLLNKASGQHVSPYGYAYGHGADSQTDEPATIGAAQES